MNVMVEKEILQALQTGLIAAVAASIAPTIGIKPVMRTFNPPAGAPWIEIVHVPNNILGEFWDASKTYRGLFRLLFRFPLLDEGAYPALDIISSVSGHFGKGSIFTSGGISVRIYDEPDLSGVIEAPPYSLYPVTVRYMSFQPERN